MRATALDTPRIESRPGPKVASFRDLHGAALAVRQLVERGFPSDEVFVRPRRMQPLEGILMPRAKRELRRRVVRAAVIGAALGGGALLATTGAIGWGVAAAAIVGAVLATVLTVIVDSVTAWRIEHRRRRSSSVVRASHFDVVATTRSDDAEHQLASWWDPQAVPANAASEPAP